MKTLAWTTTAALLLAFLLGFPFAVAIVVTVIAAPAVARQIQIDPCSAQPDTATSTGGGQLPPAGQPRRASLHNPPLPIPDRIRTLYLQAAAHYRIPWALLAGVGMEETGHGRNNDTSSAGAQGLMQFLPGTFAAYGVDGNGDGRRDIHSDADSIHSAANYLTASGARNGEAGIRKALFAYNHATWYVNDVLHYAHHYDTGTDCDPTGNDAGPLPDGPDGPCKSRHSAAERGLTRHTLRMLRCVKRAFGWITSMGGIGPRPNVSDHPSGHAVDFMIPKWNSRAGNARGWQVARWLQRNAATLKVKYIIFNNRVWRAHASSRGWARYTHPNGSTSPTLRHDNHVHCSTY